MLCLENGFKEIRPEAEENKGDFPPITHDRSSSDSEERKGKLRKENLCALGDCLDMSGEEKCEIKGKSQVPYWIGWVESVVSVEVYRRWSFRAAVKLSFKGVEFKVHMRQSEDGHWTLVSIMEVSSRE